MAQVLLTGARLIFAALRASIMALDAAKEEVER